MESIGAKLADARSIKGVSAEQAARDTHISRRYIESLEAESFDEFPGEAYLLGFLRSYSTYLGLESDDMVALYHNTQLQEQPAPIDELLDRRPSNGRGLKVLLVILLVVLAGGVVALFVTGTVQLPELPRRTAVETRDTATFVLEEQFVERRFSEGNSVAVPIDGRSVAFSFAAVGERIMIQTPAGMVQMRSGDERAVDLTGDGGADIRLAIRQIYADDQPATVVARIDRVVSAVATRPADPPREDPVSAAPFDGGSTSEPTRVRQSRVVASLPAGSPDAVLTMEAQGLAIVRYQSGDQDAVQQVMESGSRLSVVVEDLLHLWVSNAGALRVALGNTPLELGSSGEVVTVALRRAAAGSGVQVELLPLY